MLVPSGNALLFATRDITQCQHTHTHFHKHTPSIHHSWRLKRCCLWIYVSAGKSRGLLFQCLRREHWPSSKQVFFQTTFLKTRTSFQDVSKTTCKLSPFHELGRTATRRRHRRGAPARRSRGRSIPSMINVTSVKDK